MLTLRVVEHGYSCDGGLAPDGWFAGVKVIPDIDADHLAQLGRETVTLGEGKTEAEWSAAFCAAPRQLVVIGQLGSLRLERTLAEAERVDGPAASGGPQPALAWTERKDGLWRLMVWTPEKARSALESRGKLRSPALVWASVELIVACEYERDGRPVTEVFDAAGASLAQFDGARPQIAHLGAGRLLVIVERREGPQSLNLRAYECAAGEEAREIPLPPTGDYNFNADVAVDPRNGAAYVAWESCPSWGYDERVGLHRDLSLWMLLPGAASFAPAESTSNGFLRVKPEAFLDSTMQNFTPIRPRVMVTGDGPAVAWRRFRFTGVKGFGWDTFLTRRVAGGWLGPGRVSQNEGPPDSKYAIACQGDHIFGFFPSSEQRRIRTFDEEAAGEKGTGRTWYAEKHRVEVCRFGVNEALADVAMPDWKRGTYVINPALPKVAPEPLPLAGAPAGLRLIWGDLHAHSAYSKCMSANDGMPLDVLRFERDVLGCKVLCLTEHVEFMSSPEFTHVLDAVEAEAGEDRIVFYGVEWAKQPAHHTNFFAIDRQVFDRLRSLLLACDHLTPLFRRIKSELPAGSVVAIRHMHGKGGTDFGVGGPSVTATFDPAVEWAMEAMQTRGNMMFAPLTGIPAFPNEFLNGGARIGLVGGSDHSRGKGPNRFCLAGFWVPEATPQAAFGALRNRKTVAAANGKLALWASLGEASIGETTNVTGPVRVKAHLSCATTILRACLMRNGSLLAWQDVRAPVAEVELVDESPPRGSNWYSVTVEAQSAFQYPPILAHASPFFVEVG